MATPISVTDYIPLIRLSDLAYPIYMPAVRAANTNTSFPIPIRDDILLPWGYKPVRESEKPPGDVITQGEPELRDDGEYYKTWVARDFTEEEIAQNLADAKWLLLNDSYGVVGTDLSTNLPYEYNGTTYPVGTSSDQMSLLLTIKSIAKDSEDTDLFEYCFVDETLVQMTKVEFLAMVSYIFNTLYTINKNFWKFRTNVNAITSIEDLPELPTTFR